MKPVERHPWNHYGRRANQRDPGRRRLSTNVALLNASNSFTSFNGLTGVLVATNPTNQIPGTISANGSGLSNLNRANVAVGTIVNAGISATAAIAPAWRTMLMRCWRSPESSTTAHRPCRCGRKFWNFHAVRTRPFDCRHTKPPVSCARPRRIFWNWPIGRSKTRTQALGEPRSSGWFSAFRRRRTSAVLGQSPMSLKDPRPLPTT